MTFCPGARWRQRMDPNLVLAILLGLVVLVLNLAIGRGDHREGV